MTPLISDAEIERLVRRDLGDDCLTVAVSGWAPVSHAVVNSATGGLCRVTGEANGRPWSLIVKTVLAGPTSPDDPAHWNYWRREALAYQSEIPYALAPALTAPRLAGVVPDPENPSRQYLVMEEVTPEAGAAWTRADDALLAERLGQWGALPQRAPWLSPAYLRGILRSGAYIMQAVDAARVWEFPHIAREFPPLLVARIRLLLEQEESLQALLEAMPRVLCHCDTHRGNVMLSRGEDGSRQFVLIDWSTVGLGAPGEELGHQFSSNVLVGQVPPVEAADHAETLISGYCKGMPAATEHQVRTSFTVTTALRTFGFALPLILRAGSDPHNQSAIAFAPRLGANIRALLPYLDAALNLL